MVFEIVVGIGTLLILGFQVVILWKQTKISNSQKEISKDQSKYLMKKEDPQLEVLKTEYDKDKVNLYLFNKGKTKAVGIALKTEAFIVNPRIKTEKGLIQASNRGDFDYKKQTNFIIKEESYSLGSCIVDLFYDKSNYPELAEIGQTRIFTQEVLFGIYSKKEKYPTPAKSFSFKQFLELLKKIM